MDILRCAFFGRTKSRWQTAETACAVAWDCRDLLELSQDKTHSTSFHYLSSQCSPDPPVYSIHPSQALHHPQNPQAGSQAPLSKLGRRGMPALCTSLQTFPTKGYRASKQGVIYTTNPKTFHHTWTFSVVKGRQVWCLRSVFPIVIAEWLQLPWHSAAQLLFESSGGGSWAAFVLLAQSQELTAPCFTYTMKILQKSPHNTPERV